MYSITFVDPLCKLPFINFFKLKRKGQRNDKTSSLGFYTALSPEFSFAFDNDRQCLIQAWQSNSFIFLNDDAILSASLSSALDACCLMPDQNSFNRIKKWRISWYIHFYPLLSISTFTTEGTLSITR